MSASNYDDVITKLGDFGPYQKMVYYTLCIPAALKALVVINTVFVLTIPNHRCAIPGYNNDSYHIQNPYHQRLVNTTIPRDDEGGYSECQLSVAKVNNNNNNGAGLLGNVSASNDSSRVLKDCNSWVFQEEGFSQSIMTEYELVCADKVMRSHINMGLFCGSLIGCLGFGIIADLAGRKKALFACVLIQAIAGTGLYFIQSLTLMVVIRSLLGTSAEMFALSASTGMELVGPTKRTFAGMVVEFFWCGGELLLLLAAYLTGNWRDLQLFIGICGVPLLVAILFLPESPRWLLEKERYDEAEKVFEKIAASNKTSWSSEDMKSLKAEKTEKISVTVLFRSKTQVARALVIFFNWFAMNFLYYGITLNQANLSGNMYTNFLLNVAVEAIGFSLCTALLVKLGRKPVFSGGLILGSVACVLVIFPVIYGQTDDQWTVTALALLGKMCAASCYAVLYVITVELFPTSVRNSVLGVSAFFENAAGMVCPYVADLGILYGGPLQDALPLLVFGAVSFLAGVLSLTLPETRDRPMVEMDDIIAAETAKVAKKANAK